MRKALLSYLLANQFIAALFLVALIWFLAQIIYILVGIFIAYIIMAALLPLVRTLRRYKIPKTIAVVASYALVLALIVLLVFPLLPFFTSQIQSLFSNFPRYIDQAAKLLGIAVDSSQLQAYFTSQLGAIGRNAFALTGTIFSGFFFFLTIFVISIYLLMDHDRLLETIASLAPKGSVENVALMLKEIEDKLGAWVRGQFVLSLSVGFVTWGVLTFLGVQFALPLAILAGLLEIVPTIGPIMASVPAIIVALATSPATTIAVIAAYILIQMLENNLLVPKIMEKAVGLNPILVIIGVMIGSHMLGVLGALLSVPFISVLAIFFKSLKNL